MIGLKSELHEIIFISSPSGSRCVPDPVRLHVVSENHWRDEDEHQSYKISVNDVSPRDMLSVVLKYLNLVVKENMTGLHYARRDICTGLR